MADIRRMFDPKTIALIGASEKENSTGRNLLQNLLSTSGRERTIYPVNPNTKSVLNLECFPSVSALPRAVDLAVVVSPASTVPPVIEECARAGAQGVLIVSGGFKEVGPEGEKLEQEVSAIAKRHGSGSWGPTVLAWCAPTLA
jgi:acetyltransferase